MAVDAVDLVRQRVRRARGGLRTDCHQTPIPRRAASRAPELPPMTSRTDTALSNIARSWKPAPTHYATVDLDLLSRRSLQPLVDALGNRVMTLHVGGDGRKHEAHVELISREESATAERAILGFVRLIKRLPPRARELWDGAARREFNIGIEAGLEPPAFEMRLPARVVRAVNDVNGAIVVTVYAPDLPRS